MNCFLSIRELAGKVLTILCMGMLALGSWTHGAGQNDGIYFIQSDVMGSAEGKSTENNFTNIGLPGQPSPVTVTPMIGGDLKNHGGYWHVTGALRATPMISLINNQIIDEDTDTGAIPFTISDTLLAATGLTVTAESSDQTLIPDSNITFAGSNTKRTVSVTPTPDKHGGPVTITVTVNNSARTITEIFTVTVTPVNDAPVLIPATPKLTGTNERTTSADNLIANILGGNLADVDTSERFGIAITSTAGNGVWQYSLFNGSDLDAYSDFGSVSEGQSLLLRAEDQVRYIPDGVNGEIAAFNFLGWDQTSGAAGQKVSSAITGGITALSTAVDAAALNVMSLSIPVTNASCNGDSNGALDLTVIGGQSPYSFSWSTGDETEDIAGLAAGQYSVTVTDDDGITTGVMRTVTEPGALGLTLTVVDVSINGGSDGTVNLNVSGGTTPYSYLWSTGATSRDIVSLAGGSYTVTVTDANACAVATTVRINDPLPGEVTQQIFTIWVDDDESYALNFGQKVDATEVFDESYDNAHVPGAGIADVYFLNKQIPDPDKQTLASDFRALENTSRWRLVIDLADGINQPVQLTWDFPDFEESKRIYCQQLFDEMPVGNPIDMTSTTSLIVSENAEFEIVWSELVTSALILNSGWNLFGVSVMTSTTIDDLSIRDNNSSNFDWHALWYWDTNQYNFVSEGFSLNPERGYWLVNGGNEGYTYDLHGLVADGIITLQKGWNLVAPVADCPMPVKSEIMGNIWWWDSVSQSYAAVHNNENLQAGLGYWIYAAEKCELKPN